MSNEIEDVERHALAAFHAAADDELRTRLGLQSVTVGGALVSIAGAAPPSGIVANRTIGLGLAGPESPEIVSRIVELYRDAGVARYFIHVHPDAQPPNIRDWLRDAGLEKARGWMKFIRGREAPPPVETDLSVRLAEPADAPAFGRIAADAFDAGAELAEWVARLVNAEGWRIYMSFDASGEPAGTGGLFVRDGVGYCDWAATAPTFRRRGSQGALLHRRIVDAIDLGCRFIVTETGEEVEGDPQHSYKNILRMGFKEEFVRENYAPPR